MTTTEILAFLAGGGGALLLVHLLEWHERRAARQAARPQMGMAVPAQPWNSVQKAVYNPQEAVATGNRPVAVTPTKRGPGRPRKTSETPARIVGGTRDTRS